MSLLTSLVTQIAQNAIQGQGNQPMHNQNQGGMGDLLGSLLGGATQQPQQNNNNGFGLDDVIGGVLGGGMGQNSMQGNMLGQVLGSVLGGGNSSGFGGMGGNKSMLMAALLPLALSFIQKNGGLSGALSKITNMGFGQQANSWMSANQPNQAIDANAVSQLFDSQELQQVANQAGCDQGEVCQGMAELLPQVFDHLTPNGDTQTEAQANNEIGQILSQLSQFAR